MSDIDADEGDSGDTGDAARLDQPSPVDEPRLPPGIGDAPAYPQRPVSGPLLPPPVTSVPTPMQSPSPLTLPLGLRAPLEDSHDQSARHFVPLRTDPPPRIAATWWLRYLLLLTMLVAIASVVMTEYAIGPGGVAESSVVIAPHVLAAVLLVGWSIVAMFDAGRLVPATRYHRGSSSALAAVLWLLAFAVPFVFIAIFVRARTRFGAPPDDAAAVAITVVTAVIGLLVAWLPFGYLAGQARRVGAPSRVVVLWFCASLLTAVGAFVVVFIGLHDMLAESGLTSSERSLQTAVVYGVPAFVFALSTWRATTVFDEVIDLRWRRWKSEWEMTLLEMAAQPAPGPELGDPISDR